MKANIIRQQQKEQLNRSALEQEKSPNKSAQNFQLMGSSANPFNKQNASEGRSVTDSQASLECEL